VTRRPATVTLRQGRCEIIQREADRQRAPHKPTCATASGGYRRYPPWLRAGMPSTPLRS
jgi:hypothetical protein